VTQCGRPRTGSGINRTSSNANLFAFQSPYRFGVGIDTPLPPANGVHGRGGGVVFSYKRMMLNRGRGVPKISFWSDIFDGWPLTKIGNVAEVG